MKLFLLAMDDEIIYSFAVNFEILKNLQKTGGFSEFFILCKPGAGLKCKLIQLLA